MDDRITEVLMGVGLRLSIVVFIGGLLILLVWLIQVLLGIAEPWLGPCDGA